MVFLSFTWCVREAIPSRMRARTLGGLTIGLFAFCGMPACGGTAASGNSNTNWLRPCDVTADCGPGLECSCGTCTRRCNASDCSGLGEGATCVAPAQGGAAELCGVSMDGERLCTTACTRDADCTPFGASLRCAGGACLVGSSLDGGTIVWRGDAASADGFAPDATSSDASVVDSASHPPEDAQVCRPLDCEGGSCARFTWDLIRSYECNPQAFDRGYVPYVDVGCGYIVLGMMGGSLGSSFAPSSSWYDEASGELIGRYWSTLGAAPACEGRTGAMNCQNVRHCLFCNAASSAAVYPPMCAGADGQLSPWDPLDGG